MRPQKLTVQAFGPFAKTEVIDFSILGDNPLFLINGPTGAGKSALLDAMCFALYGQTSGKERDAQEMRCDLAAESLLTQVILEFSIGSRFFQIIRSPTQYKLKSRGDGFTKHQTTAEFWQIRPDKTLLVAKSAMEANRISEQLTGLCVEQFRQVMILPQGKFRDFLMADSNQRELIFSRLFQTQIYKKIEEALKAQSSSIRVGMLALTNQTTGLLNSIKMTQEDELIAQLDAIKTQITMALNHKNIALDALRYSEKTLERSRIIDKTLIALELSHKARVSLESQSAHMDSHRIRLERGLSANNISHRHKKLDDLREELQENKQRVINYTSEASEYEYQFVEAQNQLEQLQPTYDDQDSRKQKLTQLINLKPLIEQWEKSTTATLLASQLVDKSKNKLLQKQSELEVANTQLVSFLDKQSQVDEALECVQEKQEHCRELVSKLDQRIRFETLIHRQSNLQLELAGRQESLRLTQSRCDAQVLCVKNMELNWHRQQAASLAFDLKKGKACPVCGNIDHPLPATLDGGSLLVSKDEIEDAKSILQTIQSSTNQALNFVTASATELATIGEMVDELKVGVACSEKAKLELELKNIRLELESLNKLASEQQQNKSQLNYMQKSQKTLNEALFQLRDKLQDETQKHLLIQQEQGQLEASLPNSYRQLGIIEKEMTKLTNEINSVAENFEQCQARLNRSHLMQVELNTKLEVQKNQQQRVGDQLNRAEFLWKTQLKDNNFSTEAEYVSALMSIEDKVCLETKLADYLVSITDCNARIDQLSQQVIGESKPNIGELEDLLVCNQQRAQEASEKWRKLDNRHQLLTSIQQQLIKINKKSHIFDEQYQLVGTLSELTSGQSANKVSLQRFVLSNLLDEVLVEASQRLQSMSNGRYVLVRKEDRTKGNKASGLELEVEDAHTGKYRSVSSLSGGESFLASLSLALGLSELVQSYAGGIQLDTLFIDEGFGNLDQNSLDLAIRALLDLQSNGKMIGIVSHVRELREQITLRIDVISSRSGSKVEIAI